VRVEQEGRASEQQRSGKRNPYWNSTHPWKEGRKEGRKEEEESPSLGFLMMLCLNPVELL
jgi:hypothetical protein